VEESVSIIFIVIILLWRAQLVLNCDILKTAIGTYFVCWLFILCSRF